MFQVSGSLSQVNYWKLEINILDSLLTQWNGFEDLNILKFSTLLMKFAIVFKIFAYFFCLSLMIITGQWSFSRFADEFFDITPEAKKKFDFLLQNLEAIILNFACNCKFSKYQFFIWLITFTNKARKLKVAEWNQAKASLSKPWRSTDEANRSPVVWEQFARR